MLFLLLQVMSLLLTNDDHHPIRHMTLYVQVVAHQITNAMFLTLRAV